MEARQSVLIEITDPTEGAAAVVLSAAMQLFSPRDAVEVVLYVPGVEEPDEQVGALVQQLCLDGAAGELPETVLLGCSEAEALDALLRVRTGTTAADAARASALLGGLTQVLEPAADLAPQVARLEGRLLRAEVVKRHAARDPRAAVAVDRGLRRPTVALLFQHRSYWNAVATVVAALQRDPRIDLVVAALDSEADGRNASTAEFLREQGLRPVSAEHLIASLDDVDVVLLDNPYDETRPAALSAGALAERGVRLAAVPYGYGAIGGDFMDTLLWDLPLQQLAWRSYVPAETHRLMYDRHCRTGSAHVRVVGSAKLDRLVDPVDSDEAQAVRALAGDRPVVLWNPHFRMGQGGWSTFDTYFEPVLRWFMAHPEVVLLLRPHFRMFRDLAVRGGDEAKVEATVRRLVSEHENMLLDETPDYVPALTVADAMMSDLSSLATEYLVTGRPLLYLHRADGPGTNGVGDHFSLMETARGWEDVRGWLGRVRTGKAVRPDAALVAAHLGQADGRAGERIASSLVDDLVEVLVPDLPVLEAPRTVHVSAVSVDADGTRLTLDASGVDLAWVSPQLAAPAVAVVDGTAVLPSYASVLGGPVLPLPSGSYRLVATRNGVACAVSLPDVLSSGQSWNDGHCTVTLRVAGSDALELEVAPPVPRDVDRTRLIEHASYPVARTQPLDDAAVVFMSYNGTSVACSPRSLDREVARQRPDLTRYWVVQDLSVAVPDGAVPLVRGSKEHYERMATSRFVVDNEAMPAWLRKRPGQTFLQTWHGTPLKKLRWDLDEVSPRDPAFMAEVDRDAASWDVVLSPNPHSSDVLRRAFRTQGQVLEVGYPRNDLLADPVRREQLGLRTRARLGISPEAPVVLHAPTWRDTAVRAASRSGSWSYGAVWDEQPVLDVADVLEVLGEDAVVLYRGHRFVASTARELRNPGVLDVSRYPDVTDLLAVADLLVTDYSSTMFDFALTGRPMVFFAHDLEAYRDSARGLYFDMATELPGPVVPTAAEVTAVIAAHDTLPASGCPSYDAFVQRFAPWDDGHAAERVVASVFG